MNRVLDLTDRLPGLNGNSKRWVKRYLGSFYSTLASEDERKEQISGACRPWPPSAVDHTAPLDN